MKSNQFAENGGVPTKGYHNRWAQLTFGIICMALVANLQYAWTLFVSPLEAKNHWGLSAIQLSFSIFILVETWLVPIEGWLVDKNGAECNDGARTILVNQPT